jgi:membrane protease YdiL (CAAX protease family)
METLTSGYYVITISFIVYFFISYAYKVLKVRNIEAALKTSSGMLLLNIKHVIGILLFGIIFFLLFPESRSFLKFSEIPELLVVFLFIIVVLASGLLALRSVKKAVTGIRMRSSYKIDQAWHYFPIRLVFLLSYEFFFRGVLFFSVLELYGLVIALIVNTILYVLIHCFDSKNEILGAVPFGIVLCLFSYFTNSIWIAFVIHATLSLVYEFTMFKHLTIKKQKS